MTLLAVIDDDDLNDGHDEMSNEMPNEMSDEMSDEISEEESSYPPEPEFESEFESGGESGFESTEEPELNSAHEPSDEFNSSSVKSAISVSLISNSRISVSASARISFEG